MRSIALLNENVNKKKLIELPSDVCRRLAVQAAAMGLSVKRLIESLVIKSVEEADDEALFAYLCETRKDGAVMMTDSEQTALLEKLRNKASDSDEI